jgi:hypothetical protein
MATNCTAEDMRPTRRDEALAWVASAFRSERFLTALHDDEDESERPATQ